MNEKSYDHKYGESFLRADEDNSETKERLRNEALDIIKDAQAWVVMGVVEKDGKNGIPNSIYSGGFGGSLAGLMLYHTRNQLESYHREILYLTERLREAELGESPKLEVET